MAKVKFLNVGRDKRSWEEEIAEPTEERLELAVRMTGFLRSQDITCTQGVVYAGMRPVGSYQLPDGAT
jgi:hypothetical protein